MTSFIGWADAWGNSWGSAVDPNAMHGSASFSFTAVLTVNTGEMVAYATMGLAGTATLTLPLAPSGEVILKKRRYYVRKNGKILLFDSAGEADSYIDKEHQAELQARAKTSRRARKRVIDAATSKFTPEVVDLHLIKLLTEKYDIPNLLQFVDLQDWDKVLEMQALAIEMEEEEDSVILALP